MLIAMVESYLRSRKVGMIKIDFVTNAENHFLDSLEIKRLLTANGQDNLQGSVFRNVSIKALESRVKSNLFVAQCEIARNLRGDLWVKVIPSHPIARFLREGKPDFYIDSLGKVMPVSEKYSARAMLITREDKYELPDFQKKDFNLLLLLRCIHRDKFLKAQIAQIHIDQYGNLILYPQVGSQRIEFGKCYDLKDKLRRLRIFYQEILPRKGWNKYKKVSLKFSGQVVCE